MSVFCHLGVKKRSVVLLGLSGIGWVRPGSAKIKDQPLANQYKVYKIFNNFIYGINHIIAKGVMPHKIGASAFVFLRILGAGLLFWALKFFIKESVKKKDLARLLICGMLGVAANQMLFFHGLKNYTRHWSYRLICLS